jgi:hypothetical protein
MRKAKLSLVVLVATLLAGGGGVIEPLAHAQSSMQSYTTGDASVRSSLIVGAAAGVELLRSVTELSNGNCLTEEATTDETGRLLRAELTLHETDGDRNTRVVLDPRHGTVELTTATVHTRWAVPSDLPWVWAPLRDPAAKGVATATPLGAVVALRGAAGDRPVRLLDLTKLESFTLMADQLVVRGERGVATVVLGDDYVEMEGGLPRRVHLAALHVDLEAIKPSASARGISGAACPTPARSITL